MSSTFMIVRRHNEFFMALCCFSPFKRKRSAMHEHAADQ
ncbi:hypothetical protein D2M30_1916 [Bacillus amyloliquefaciens]|nr:hypothetical protein D2M30_1916 [Bacillus amyloliquefaciens]